MRVIMYKCDWCGKLHKSEADIISRGRYYSKLTFHFCDKSCEKAYREGHLGQHVKTKGAEKRCR